MNESKYKGENLVGSPHRSPYPTSRLAPPVELVELAKEVAAADDLLTLQAVGKLRLLAEEIERLQRSARKILAETRRNQELHRVECRFRKIPGNQYHLYRRSDRSQVFSMIGPDEWGSAHRLSELEYCGTYRLDAEQTWKRTDIPDPLESSGQEDGSGG